MLNRTGRGRGAMSGLSLLMLASLCAISTARGATPASSCADCAQLNKPHKPFRIYGNTYFVGTEGLSSILITGEYGHVLIDGGLPESAPLIRASIEALGFRITDVKTILSSHAHLDQAGGISQLQRDSGADVFALRANEAVLRTGKHAADDPQAGGKPDIPPVQRVWVVQDDQQVAQGLTRVRVMATPGHSPGGTSWTWESCEGGTCLNLFYVDNLTAEAAGRFRFKDHPQVLADFEKGFKRLETARCDLLLTARPDASQLFQRLDPQGGARPASVKDDTACRRHAQAAREALAKYIAAER